MNGTLEIWEGLDRAQSSAARVLPAADLDFTIPPRRYRHATKVRLACDLAREQARIPSPLV
jgi:hypothetical protein